MSSGLQLQRCEWASLVGTVLFAQGLGRMSVNERSYSTMYCGGSQARRGRSSSRVIVVIYGCIVVCMCQQTAAAVVVVAVAAGPYNKGG